MLELIQSLVIVIISSSLIYGGCELMDYIDNKFKH